MTEPESRSRRVARRTVLVIALGLACAGCAADGSGEDGRPLRMGMMPKLIGISYFNACERGAREAAEELGIDLDYDGPAVDKVEEQVKMIDRWIAQGYDIIAVAPNDPEVISPALRRARRAGIVVLTWDADANAEASERQYFINQAPTEGIGDALVEVMAEGIGGEGKTLIVTGSAASPNQNAWMKVMRARLSRDFPGIEVLEPLASDEDQSKAQQLTTDALSAHPDLAGVWGITSVSLPAAAKAVRDAGRAGEVYVTGLSLPNEMREYVEDGTVEKFVLWNPVDLGYLTVQVAARLAEEEIQPGSAEFGRLQGVQVQGDEVLLGPPMIFDSENIDAYDF